MAGASDTAAAGGTGRRPWGRALADLAVLIVLAALWGQLAAAALHYGWAWTWFGGRLGTFDQRAVERCLFEADPEKTYDALIIGSPSFLAGLRGRLPGRAEVLEIEIPAMTLPAAAAAAEAADRLKFRAVLIQNQPHYWTDLRLEGIVPEQTTDLWRKYGRTRFSWLPLEESRIFFEAAGRWAKGLGMPPRLPLEKRPPTLLNAAFDFERLRRTYFAEPEPFGKHGTDRVFWITDRSFRPKDMDPSIIKGFERVFAAGNRDPVLGRFIEPGDVGAVFKPGDGAGHAG